MQATSDAPRILLVDDDVDTCRNLSDILGDLGYALDVAHDGPAALELVEQRRYELALLDFMLPGMDGLSLYRLIKARSAATTGILITAFASRTTLDEATAAGIWRVLDKPLALQSLLGLIDRAVRRPGVLIVDDDRELCANLGDLLREHGFRVDLAYDIHHAAVLKAAARHEVLLIDMKLPWGDGLSAYRLLRQIDAQVRAILITGVRQEVEGRIDEALRDGADSVCFKPFEVSALLDAIDRCRLRVLDGADA